MYEIPTIRALTSGSGAILSHVLRDWRVAGVVTANTGRPFTILANANNGSLGNLGGLVTQYGNCLGSGDLASSERTVTRWFNTADFATPANPVRLGNCGRNTMVGPGAGQYDMSLTRSFKYLGEGRRLDLRWDMLNVFNNTHFGLPNNDVTSSQFGQITSAADPRIMQFAVKYAF